MTRLKWTFTAYYSIFNSKSAGLADQQLPPCPPCPVLWSPSSQLWPPQLQRQVFFPGGQTASAGSSQSGGAGARHRGPLGSLSLLILSWIVNILICVHLLFPLIPSLFLAYYKFTAKTVMARWSTLSVTNMENPVLSVFLMTLTSSSDCWYLNHLLDHLDSYCKLFNSSCFVFDSFKKQIQCNMSLFLRYQ